MYEYINVTYDDINDNIEVLDTTNKLREAFVAEGAALKANETQMNTLSSQLNRFKNISKETIGQAFKPLLEAMTALLRAFNWFTGNDYGKFVTKWLLWTTTIKLAVNPLKSLWSIMKNVNLSLKVAPLLTNNWTTTIKNLRTACIALSGKLKSLGIGLLLDYLIRRKK